MMSQSVKTTQYLNTMTSTHKGSTNTTPQTMHLCSCLFSTSGGESQNPQSQGVKIIITSPEVTFG